jgi:hypothetical protein
MESLLQTAVLVVEYEAEVFAAMTVLQEAMAPLPTPLSGTW